MLSKIRPLVAALAAAFLGGCYESDEPAITTGEQAQIAGTFTCSIMGKKDSSTLTEIKSGVVFKDYTYADNSGTQLKLKNTGGTMFAAQIKSAKDPKFNYLFLDVLDSDHYIVLIPDFMSKGPYVENLLKKSGIEGKPAGEMGSKISLQGSAASIANFLALHDKGILSVVGECKKSS